MDVQRSVDEIKFLNSKFCLKVNYYCTCTRYIIHTYTKLGLFILVWHLFTDQNTLIFSVNVKQYRCIYGEFLYGETGETICEPN